MLYIGGVQATEMLPPVIDCLLADPMLLRHLGDRHLACLKAVCCALNSAVI